MNQPVTSRDSANNFRQGLSFAARNAEAVVTVAVLAIATIVVLVMGINNPALLAKNKELMVSALVGAIASTIIALIIKILSRYDVPPELQQLQLVNERLDNLHEELNSLPAPALNKAKDLYLAPGYFRRHGQFVLELKERDGKLILYGRISSIIVALVDEFDLYRINFDNLPDGAESLTDERHEIWSDQQLVRQNLCERDEKRQRVSIEMYGREIVEEANFSLIFPKTADFVTADRHTWTTFVEEYDIQVSLPEDFLFTAYEYTEADLGIASTVKKNVRSYENRRKLAAFPLQGFAWKIDRNSIVS